MKPVLIEALCAHEALRKLGFPADDIFLELAGVDGLSNASWVLFVVLKRPDGVFRAGVGVVSASKEEIQKRWAEEVNVWNRLMTDSEKTERWEASVVRRASVEFVSALVAAGVSIPSIDHAVPVFH